MHLLELIKFRDSFPEPCQNKRTKDGSAIDARQTKMDKIQLFELSLALVKAKFFLTTKKDLNTKSSHFSIKLTFNITFQNERRKC